MLDDTHIDASLVERRRRKRLGFAGLSVVGLNLTYVAGAAIGSGAALTLFVALTALTGFADAQGFVHASRIWDDGKFVWREAWLSGAAFSVGVVAYWAVVRFIADLGVRSAVIQTMGWFAVTIAAVAVTDAGGRRWEPLDVLTAVVVVAGLALLFYRNAG